MRNSIDYKEGLKNMTKKLYRSRNGSIAGVCQGLANWSGVSVGVIRLIFIISAFFWGSTIFLYILLALLISKEPVSPRNNQSEARYRTYTYRTDNVNREAPRNSGSGIHNETLTDEIRRKKQKESDWDSKFHRY